MERQVRHRERDLESIGIEDVFPVDLNHGPKAEQPEQNGDPHPAFDLPVKLPRSQHGEENRSVSEEDRVNVRESTSPLDHAPQGWPPRTPPYRMKRGGRNEPQEVDRELEAISPPVKAVSSAQQLSQDGNEHRQPQEDSNRRSDEKALCPIQHHSSVTGPRERCQEEHHGEHDQESGVDHLRQSRCGEENAQEDRVLQLWIPQEEDKVEGEERYPRGAHQVVMPYGRVDRPVAGERIDDSTHDRCQRACSPRERPGQEQERQQKRPVSAQNVGKPEQQVAGKRDREDARQRNGHGIVQDGVGVQYELRSQRVVEQVREERVGVQVYEGMLEIPDVPQERIFVERPGIATRNMGGRMHQHRVAQCHRQHGVQPKDDEVEFPLDRFQVRSPDVFTSNNLPATRYPGRWPCCSCGRFSEPGLPVRRRCGGLAGQPIGATPRW